ncbi:MAG TPA: PHP domain-containing protein, partial [Elusimicrobiota bacterium]|nr:PHP domain-containing protein [Elusimicrobiota bacterium]
YARPEGGVRIENRHPSDDRAAADAAAAPIPDRLRPWLPSSWNKEDWTGRVTMHLHSVYSDGTMTPAAVVQAAYDKGVRSLALTDHDTFAGVPEAWEKVREINAKFPGDPIEFHPGAELSSQHGAHIGALDIDVSAPKLVALVERVRVMRYQRAQAIVAHLNARFAASDDPKEKGVRITIEEVAAKSQHANGGTIELPHIARVLVDKGLIAHVDDAFNSYLKGDIGGSAGGADPDAREVLEAIHAGGGKAFLNHPYTVRGATEADGDQAALDLLRLGMDGIEVYRPSHATSENGKRRLDQRVAQYLQWIEQLGKEGLHLLSAPGADFHGLDTHLDSIVVWMPKVLAQQLLDGLRSARDSAVAALDRVAARQPESAHHS